MRKYISTIVFWGALWGITEATVGYALHMVSFGIGWFFWFPLAFFFMNRVYKDTGKLSSILYTCSFASAIKLTNLFLPTRIDKVLNPAISILFEGMVVFILIKIVQKYEQKVNFRFFWVLAVSMSWKVFYSLYLLTLPSWIVSISPIRSLEPFLKFFFIESIINALVIYGCLKVVRIITAIDDESKTWYKLFNNIMLKSKVFSEYAFKPAVSFSLLGSALIIQLVL
jgi:hypothetical protein